MKNIKEDLDKKLAKTEASIELNEDKKRNTILLKRIVKEIKKYEIEEEIIEIVTWIREKLQEADIYDENGWNGNTTHQFYGRDKHEFFRFEVYEDISDDDSTYKRGRPKEITDARTIAFYLTSKNYWWSHTKEKGYKIHSDISSEQNLLIGLKYYSVRGDEETEYFFDEEYPMNDAKKALEDLKELCVDYVDSRLNYEFYRKYKKKA